MRAELARPSPCAMRGGHFITGDAFQLQNLSGPGSPQGSGAGRPPASPPPRPKLLLRGWQNPWPSPLQAPKGPPFLGKVSLSSESSPGGKTQEFPGVVEEQSRTPRGPKTSRPPIFTVAKGEDGPIRRAHRSLHDGRYWGGDALHSSQFPPHPPRLWEVWGPSQTTTPPPNWGPAPLKIGGEGPARWEAGLSDVFKASYVLAAIFSQSFRPAAAVILIRL